MANLKSSKKRIRSNIKKERRNVSIRTGIKTVVKNVEKAAAGKDEETAKAMLSEAASALDSAAVKGVIKKNYASRKKSRLAKMINASLSA